MEQEIRLDELGAVEPEVGRALGADVDLEELGNGREPALDDLVGRRAAGDGQPLVLDLDVTAAASARSAA
jgi:hypothetical protein